MADDARLRAVPEAGSSVEVGTDPTTRDMTIEQVQKKQSIALSRSLMRYHPAIQNDIAEMVLELEAIGLHVERIAQDWADGA